MQRFHNEWIQSVKDITDFVHEQEQNVIANKLYKLISPSERIYIPSDPEISRHIQLTGFASKPAEQDSAQCGKTDFVQMLDSLKPEGACCTELLTQACQLMTHDPHNTDPKPSQDVIVCLGGAFNPVHTRHLEVVTEAMKWIKENTNFRVVDARLAVAPDGYVKSKCRRTGQKCMKGKHRIRLCELICKDNDNVYPSTHTVGSALQCGERVKKDVPFPDAKVAVIVGADRAVNNTGKAKWDKKGNHVTICVGRKGEDMDKMRNTFVEDLKLGMVRNPDFYFVEKEMDNVSSTDIRAVLAELDSVVTPEAKVDIVERIVKKGWITQEAGDYILENYDDLYF